MAWACGAAATITRIAWIRSEGRNLAYQEYSRDSWIKSCGDRE